MNQANRSSETLMAEEEVKGKDYTIFVVEDSDIYRMMLDRFLRKMTNVDLTDKPEVEILSFASGEECLAMMEKKKPDIIIMDYYLNGHHNGKPMDGLELLKQIKKRAPKTEVLVLSQQEDVLIAAELFNQGASAYISKEPHGENRVQNVLMDTIKKLERKKKEKIRRAFMVIIALIIGIVIGWYLK